MASAKRVRRELVLAACDAPFGERRCGYTRANSPSRVLLCAAVADPVSWLQIAQGWSVIASDGVTVGAVAQVEGDKQSDIFDGLAVTSGNPAQIRYVPGEQVGLIYPGEVTLKISSADAVNLEPFHAPPPETTWRPGKAPLSHRISNWMRGKR